MSAGFLSLFFGISGGFVVGYFVGLISAERLWKSLLVKKDKAEYYLDENNNKQWRWK